MEYTARECKDMYHALLMPRMVEERMLLSLRQGKISKWFSAWGQEAISVGATLALQPDEFICTMHRNLGVFTSRGIPLARLFSQFQGKQMGFTQGRDRSFHFGTKAHHIVGMISHLGSQMGVAAGLALNEKLNQTKKTTLVFTGDGGASQGDFHEALNVAAVWQLPLIVVVENNQWGLSTPSREQFRMNSFADKGVGYGIDAESIDGNDLLVVRSTLENWAKELRERPRPVLIECKTFRMRGHEEASGTAYYPEGLSESWEQFDPIRQFENRLLSEKIIEQEEINRIRNQMSESILEALAQADREPKIVPDLEREEREVYAPFANAAVLPSKLENKELRLVDAIQEGLRMAMERHPNLILMGQDIAEYGGVFKVTEGFVETFGKERVRNTPLCEAAILGSALGLSIGGRKSMVEMQFSDFVTEGFNQIVNNLAKVHYRWGQNADVVIRMPTGAGVAAGPFHSQSTEAWFTRVPGLKIVYPSNPEDAKGLILQSFNDPNPVLFFEHKKLYRSQKQAVPSAYYCTPIGKARYVQKGELATIVTYGMGVHWAQDWLQKNPNQSVELIDLRSLLPWDKEMVFESVKKTGKVLLLTEDRKTGSWMNEIAAAISEVLFEYLDAPVMRVGSAETPVPFSAELENAFLPIDRFSDALNKLLNY